MDEEAKQILQRIDRLCEVIEKQAIATQQAVAAIAMIADLLTTEPDEPERPRHL